MLNASIEFLKSIPSISGYSKAEYNRNSISSDMGRASIVLVVAAFDDYFTRRFSEDVVTYLKVHGVNDELVNMLSKSGLDLKGALALLAMDRPYRRIKTLIQTYFDTYTTQRFVAIDNLFLAFGIRNFSQNVQNKCHRKKMRRSIEKLVLRRHDIAHSGDLTKTGRLQVLDPEDTLYRTKLMIQFVEAADGILDNRLK